MASDIFGMSGRAMRSALIAGERDPQMLADMVARASWLPGLSEGAWMFPLNLIPAGSNSRRVARPYSKRDSTTQPTSGCESDRRHVFWCPSR